MSEHNEQSAFFSLLKMNEQKYPFLKFIHSVPNGGKRHVATAVKLKKEGATAGVWDVFVPIPRHGFNGFYLEFKYGKNTLSDAQKEFQAAVLSFGYKTTVVYSWTDAAKEVEQYLGIKLSL